MSEEAKDTKKAEPQAEGGSDKTGKLGLILAAINLVLVIGIGAVVFLQFQKEKHKESHSDIDAHAEAHGGSGEGHGAEKAEHGGGEKAEGGEHGGGHGGGGHGAPAAKKGDQLVTLEQFTVNLATSPGTPPRYARVIIALEVPSSKTAQEITQKLAPVRNAIIDLFNSKRPTDLQGGEGRNFLKEEIRNALNSFLITGKVKSVFFSNFAVSS
ncbi:MAG: flagellar basal body-associated FliL family protein [Bdellovibrionales bacterium]|nr:flagellar basal body-associated FliL family protein [Bdellovibrionales bacterium]